MSGEACRLEVGSQRACRYPWSFVAAAAGAASPSRNFSIANVKRLSSVPHAGSVADCVSTGNLALGRLGRTAGVSIRFTACQTVPPRRASHIVSGGDPSSYQSRTPVTPRTRTVVVRTVGTKSAASRRRITPRADDKPGRH